MQVQSLVSHTTTVVQSQPDVRPSFDLSVDPAEAHPLDRASHGPVLAEIKRIRAAKLKNVLETFHSVANYEQGPAGPGGPSPCCNPKNVNCRCTN